MNRIVRDVVVRNVEVVLAEGRRHEVVDVVAVAWYCRVRILVDTNAYVSFAVVAWDRLVQNAERAV